MPSYIVTAPDGRKLKLTGDTPPTEAELEDIFQSQAPPSLATQLPASPEAQAVLANNSLTGSPWMKAAPPEETLEQTVKAFPKEVGQAIEETGANSINYLTPAGLGFQAKYGQPFAVPGESLIDIPKVPAGLFGAYGLGTQIFGSPEATRGLEETGGQMLSGFTTPGSVATLPFAEYKPVQAYFAAQAAMDLPENYREIKEAKTPEERSAAYTHALGNLGMLTMMGTGLLGRKGAPAGISPEVEAAALKGGIPARRLGITGVDPNVLHDIPPDLVNLALEQTQRPDIIGGPVSALDRIRGLQEVQPEPLEEPTALKEKPLKGQIRRPLAKQFPPYEEPFIERFNRERLAATGEFPPNPVLPEPETVTGPEGPYRRPIPAPTVEQFEKQQAKRRMEQDMLAPEQPGYDITKPIVPEGAPGPLPEGQPLSNLQKARLAKAVERGADIETLRNILRLPKDTTGKQVLAIVQQASQAGEAIRGQTIVKPRGVNPFFDRAGEVSITGGESLPPTIEQIRAQRALEERKANAPTTRQQQEGGQPEHTGTPLGEHLRENGPEVRQGQGERAVSGNRPEPSGTEFPKPKTEIERLSAMSAEELLKQNRNITESAYGLAERVTGEDIPKLEQAAKDAVADQDKVHEELANAKTLEEKIPIMQRGMAAAMKNQFFVEAARMRRALDEAHETGATSLEDFAKLEQKHGVGKGRGSATPGSMLKEMYERSRPVDPATAAFTKALEKVAPHELGESIMTGPEHVFEGSTPLEPSSGTPLSETTGTKLSATDALIERLEALKLPNDFKPGPTRYGFFGYIPHPNEIIALGKDVWNGGLEVAIKAIKAGKTVADAIDAAIRHMKYNGKAFDETKMRNNLKTAIAHEMPPRVEGTEQQTRKSAARAATSPQIPPAVQQRIRTAPESKYNVQPGDDVEQFVHNLTNDDLHLIPKSSNVYVAAKLELANRLFNQGRDAEGYKIFKEVSQTGTDFGQNINQFKRLVGANPANIVKLVDRGLAEAGRDPLNPQQVADLARKSKTSIDANKALENAKKKWLGDPTDANAKAAQDALDATHKTDVELQQEINRYKVRTWPQMLKAFAQGNPLTPISQVSNFLGNAMGAAMESSSRSAGAFLDAVRSMLTGGPRYISVHPEGVVEAAKGFVRGAKEAPGIMRFGAGDVVKGETRQGLQPLRSFMKAFAANPDVPTIGGKVPFSERVRLAVEGVFGIAPETMLRMLAAADRPAYEAARSRLIAEQARLHGVPADKLPFAQKFPELFFTPDIVKQIKEESSHAVFQNPSKSVSFLEKLIKEKGGDWGDLAFTLLVAPYKLTPWNLVGRTLNYNPLIAAMLSARDALKGNVRGAELNAGRMMVGSVLYGAGFFLYKNGLIGPSLDTQDEQQKNRLLSGEILPPNHVNISGLKRLVNGGSPHYVKGDETWDLTRGGGAAGAILASVANIGRDFEKKPKDAENFLPTLLANSTFEQANFTINQSYLKGVTGALDAVKNRNIEPYMNGVENMMLNVPTPNTLSTLSRATRPYMPDLKGDTLAKGFENVVRNRFGFAGADDYLPIKRDLWGEPMKQTPEGRNALLYHFFDISKNKQVSDDPVSMELYELWRRTANNAAIPSIPVRRMTIGNVTYPLTAKQYERYAELVGKNRRLITQEMVTNPEWQRLSDEIKLKLLDNAYTRGLQVGKAQFVGETPPNQLTPKEQKAGFQ